MGSIGARRAPIIQDKASLYKAVDKLAENYWNVKRFGYTSIVDSTKEEYREAVDRIIAHFEERGESILTPSTEYPDEIVWHFSGRDSFDKHFASFDLDGGLHKDKVAENVRANGYSIRFLLPTKLFDYATDYTSMQDQEMRIINAVATQALKEYRNRRK